MLHFTVFITTNVGLLDSDLMEISFLKLGAGAHRG
jgi:hypothetical protein